MQANITIMQQARTSLSGKWRLAIGTLLIYIIITSVPDHLEGVGTLISLIISGPFSLGLAMFSLNITRDKEARLEQIFEGFHHFETAFKAYLLILLNVIVKLLLLIVPGIMTALAYSMTYYVLADNSKLTAREAMKKSENMMMGHKLKLFQLGLRLFGLALLCILTLGIGFLWLFPYANITVAKFYDDVKEAYQAEELIYQN